MSKNADIAVSERSFIVNYSSGGHCYLYSFDESRINDVLGLVRGQADDSDFPLTDMDCLRLSAIFKLAVSAMEPGGVIDASSHYSKCEIFCVGALAKKTSVPIAPTGPEWPDAGHVVSDPKPEPIDSSKASTAGNGCCHVAGGVVVGFLVGSFFALCVANIYVLFVCLFSLFAGR